LVFLFIQMPLIKIKIGINEKIFTFSPY